LYNNSIGNGNPACSGTCRINHHHGSPLLWRCNWSSNLTVTGGTAPYTYLWSNGATTEDLTNVVAGTYNVTITDANGCTTTASGTVTQPAAALAGTTTTTPVLCFGDATGAVNLTVTGGTAPYTYLWSNGATTEDLTNVIAGTYNVTITDANGCTTTASGIVTQPAAALAGTTTTTAVLCFGDATGAVTLPSPAAQHHTAICGVTELRPKTLQML
jgi:large repetitive protein